jgi:hypothetical protein
MESAKRFRSTTKHYPSNWRISDTSKSTRTEQFALENCGFEVGVTV